MVNELLMRDNKNLRLEELVKNTRFNLDSEIMALKIMDEAYKDFFKNHTIYIPAGKPWAECPVASGIFFNYIHRKIKNMTVNDYKKESESIIEDIEKSINEQYISESSGKALYQYLKRKKEYCFEEKSIREMREDKRERHRLIGISRRMK